MANLDRELETYKKALPALLGEQGKFVLILDDQILGTFESYSDALQAGYQVAGLKEFLVKRISGAESLAFYTRELAVPCPH